MTNIEFQGGRLPNDPTKPRLLLGTHLTAVPTYPNEVDYLSAVTDWPMYLNDRIGDCTCAGAGHIIQAESRYGQGTTQTITDNEVLKAYEDVGGYVPGKPSTDGGAVMQDVLNYWRKTGIGGHKILAFAQVDHKNEAELRAALNVFGNLYIGINFPGSGMDQFNNGQPWDVVPGATIEGGHAIHGGAYKVGGNWKVITWGAVQEMTQAFWNKYVEEAWVVITPEWLKDNKSPSGFDLAGLGQELADITGGANPFPSPTPAPTPTPVPTPTPTPTPSDADQVLQAFLTEWYGKGYTLPRHPVLNRALKAWLDSRS